MRNFHAPERYSPEWWLWITSATSFFAVLSFAGLYYLDIFTNIRVLIGAAILVSLAGDLLVATAFEAIAPSKISLAPGERTRNDQEASAEGVVESGFKSSAIGRVSTRGELWDARHHAGQPVELVRGDKIKIVGRDGLTLLVDDPENI